MFFFFFAVELFVLCRVSDEKKRRFESALKAPSARIIQIRGVLFVLVNSMALEGDGCEFCMEAELELRQISTHLKCAKVNFSV